MGWVILIVILVIGGIVYALGEYWWIPIVVIIGLVLAGVIIQAIKKQKEIEQQQRERLLAEETKRKQEEEKRKQDELRKKLEEAKRKQEEKKRKEQERKQNEEFLALPEPQYTPIPPYQYENKSGEELRICQRFANYLGKYNDFKKSEAHYNWLKKCRETQLALNLSAEDTIPESDVLAAKEDKKAKEILLNESREENSYVSSWDKEWSEFEKSRQLLDEFVSQLKLSQSKLNTQINSKIVDKFLQGLPCLKLRENRYLCFTKLYCICVETDSGLEKTRFTLVSYKSVEIRTDYTIEQLTYSQRMDAEDEYAGREYLYTTKDGFPDRRYSYNPSYLKVYRGHAIIRYQNDNIKINYQNRKKSVKLKELLDKLKRNLSSASMARFVSTLCKSEKDFNSLDANIVFEEVRATIEAEIASQLKKEERRKKLEEERLEKERIAREQAERKRREEAEKAERKRKEEEERRRKEEEERQQLLAVQKKLEALRLEEERKREVEIRKELVAAAMAKEYAEPEQKPLYLLLDIKNPENTYNLSVRSYSFSPRFLNIVQEQGYTDIFSILSRSIDDLMSLPGVGRALVADAIRTIELRLKGVATYKFSHKEPTTRVRTVVVHDTNQPQFTEEEIRMIMEARRAKEDETKKAEEERARREHAANLATIDDTAITQVTGKRIITNNIFGFSYCIGQNVKAEKLELFFVDELGNVISKKETVELVGENKNFRQTFELLPNIQFDSSKTYYLFVKSALGGEVVGKLDYKIDIAFTSDFDL